MDPCLFAAASYLCADLLPSHNSKSMESFYTELDESNDDIPFSSDLTDRKEHKEFLSEDSSSLPLMIDFVCVFLTICMV